MRAAASKALYHLAKQPTAWVRWVYKVSEDHQDHRE